MMFSLAGIAWLATPTRPNVATIADSAIASGTSAATSDPRTSIRTMIVSGIEIMPALPRPPAISSSIALSVDAPTDSSVTPACRASTFSTAAASLSM